MDPAGGETLEGRFLAAVEAGDAAQIRRLAAGSPGLTGIIDQPRFAFASPALVFAAGRRDRGLVDALLDAGADPDARSEWEAGPYSALHSCIDGPTPESLALAAHLATRGARIDLHAAAGMARVDVINRELDAEPSRVNEPGPDGATPLHLAANPAVARLLLERGADLEQRCVDHRSTPLMWSVQGREPVTRFLVEAGARPDLFIAAVLNDVSIAERVLLADPGAIDVRVGVGESHDHLGQGDKYVWALGFADTPLEVARRRQHDEIYEALLRRSPPTAQLVQACRRNDAPAVRELLGVDPKLCDRLDPHDAREALIAGPLTSAVLLDAGMNPNRRDSDGATALHHAAWRGDRPLVELLLAHGADPAVRDATHTSSPLGWADFNHKPGIVDVLSAHGGIDLIDACWLGRIDRVAELLDHPSERPIVPDEGIASPLRTAASFGHLDIVKLLLAHGADPSIAHSETGRTALDQAIERGHDLVADLLRRHSTHDPGPP